MKNLEYSGNTSKGLKEGKGVLYDKTTEEFYAGSFIKDKYDGYGFLYLGNT